MFGKKKKKPIEEAEVEETLPTGEEEEETDNEAILAELNEQIAKLSKKAKKPKKAVTIEAPQEKEPKGEFSLDRNEMALAVNALANSEEFKLYRQMVIGQQVAVIIEGYNKVVGGKSEISSSEDTEEEDELPQG